MTDSELLELCKQHFAFLGKAAQVTKLRDVKTQKWIGSRKVIEKECVAAIQKINEHFEANRTLEI